jgi:hypothetical protein
MLFKSCHLFRFQDSNNNNNNNNNNNTDANELERIQRKFAALCSRT